MFTYSPEALKCLRKKFGLTQSQFAEKFQIPLKTLQNWEQGDRQPEGPTLSYLRVIAAIPHEVQKVFL